jgi:uncharacterized protein (TIGR04255 family)
VQYAVLIADSHNTMQNFPLLTKAPIAEAVIEIRVRMSRPVQPDCFVAFRDRLKDQFPKAQNIRFLASHLQFDGEEQVKNDVSNSLFGVRLDDAAGRWVVQGKSDGLAVSRLPPYESWGGLIAAVQNVWPVYVEIFEPEAVLRLGVRYINRVPLPDADNVDLDLVLTGAPKIPPKLPQGLAQFVTRVVLPIEAQGVVLTIVQAMEPASADSAGVGGYVVLDIDAACERSFGPDGPEMWEKLDALREAKNVAFFGSLTESTWKQFL